MHPKAIALQAGTPGRFPVICAPLVGHTRDRLFAEAKAVAAKQPDLLEWRVDFFEEIGDTAAVLATGARLREAAGAIPILFTRRRAIEGGEPITLTEPDVIDLYRAICAGGCVDMIDFEMSNDAQHVRQVREMSRAAGLPLILSFHDFRATPPLDELLARFERAQQLGADVAKVAVMPARMDDVLTLLCATLQASRTLSIPVVSMAMGPLGAVTRLSGWAFGSAMTFAVGEGSSAPGQMPIEDVTAGIASLRKAMGAPSPSL
jgi:3-dehydroquinate dehydratase-1